MDGGGRAFEGTVNGLEFSSRDYPIYLRRGAFVPLHVDQGDEDPGYELVRELFVSSAAGFSCPQCGRAGLAAEISSPEDDDDDWGEGRLCRSCQKPIPPERLEVFPDAEYCAACQETASDTDASEEPEFCPQCGSIMVLRTSRTGGITRYVMACTACRK